MIVISLSAVLKQSAFLRALLAAGIGAEVFLIWFQVQEQIFCPFCLAFAGCVLGAFLINYKPATASGWKTIPFLFGEVHFFSHPRRYPLILFVLAGFIFFFLVFSGSTVPVYAAEPMPRIYGQGEQEIRIYTDYFCAPCRSVETKIEKTIEEAVRKGKGRIVFIDTPVHGGNNTVLYARYYIYALEAADSDIRTANRIRQVLFEAAEKKITAEGELADFLKAKQIPLIMREVNSVFTKYNEYLKADRIKSTPTLVVITNSGKTFYEGSVEITDALGAIIK
jgi:thiol:disulfide interchange protein DsbA